MNKPCGFNAQNGKTCQYARDHVGDCSYNRRSHGARILYTEPSADHYRALHAEVTKIRLDLSAIRHRVATVADTETYFRHDSIAGMVEGALTLDVIALHGLVNGGERDLALRADSIDAMFAEARAHPERFVVREGKP